MSTFKIAANKSPPLKFLVYWRFERIQKSIIWKGGKVYKFELFFLTFSMYSSAGGSKLQ